MLEGKMPAMPGVGGEEQSPLVGWGGLETHEGCDAQLDDLLSEYRSASEQVSRAAEESTKASDMCSDRSAESQEVTPKRDGAPLGTYGIELCEGTGLPVRL